MIVKTNKAKILVGASLALLFFLLSGFLFIVLEDNDNAENEQVAVEETVLYPEKANIDSDIDIDAAAALSIYFDEEETRILYEKNADTSLPIASITKIMSALVVIEEYDMTQSIGIGEDMIYGWEFRDFRAWNETKIGEMLYPMLIESNNSMAFALAMISGRFLDKEGDPIENFVNKMNEKGKEIGLQSTYFINPTGLDERDNINSSTAQDITILAKHVLLETDIFDILSKPSYHLYSSDRTVYYISLNTNKLLNMNERRWEEKIIGGKTGWTYNALGCLLLVLESPEGEGYLINVILGAENRFEEMKKLVDYVHEAYNF